MSDPKFPRRTVFDFASEPPIEDGFKQVTAGLPAIANDRPSALTAARLADVGSIADCVNGAASALSILNDGARLSKIHRSIVEFDELRRNAEGPLGAYLDQYRASMKRMSEPFDELRRQMRAVDEITRANRLALQKIYSDHSATFDQISVIQSYLRDHQALGASIARPYLDSFRTDAIGFGHALTETRLKLASQALLATQFGWYSDTAREADGVIFGSWRLRPDLPVAFWDQPTVRRRMYEDADVDAGLVHADTVTAIDIAVESGFAPGVHGENGAVILLPLRSKIYPIRAPQLDFDANAAVEGIELDLRDFIDRTLSGVFGPDWLKARHGRLWTKVKDNKRQAVRSGEQPVPHIHYLDLGELGELITHDDNWEKVFGSYFFDKTGFNFHIARLLAVRRPVAHYRPVDAVMMMELVAAMWRLTQQMRGDGEGGEGPLHRDDLTP